MTHIELVPVTGGLTSEQVETSNIKNLSVTEAKIGPEAVSGLKTRKANFPSQPAAEGEQKSPTFLGAMRTSWTAYNAKNETTVKKVKHFLETENIGVVSALVVTGGKKQTLPVKKWKEESSTELEIEFTEAPAAKAEVWIFVAG